MTTQEFKDRAPQGMGTSDGRGPTQSPLTTWEPREPSPTADKDRRSSKDGSSSSPADIEREIDRTRTRIEARAEELEGRLEPGRLFEEAVQRVTGSGVGEFVANLGRDARDKPLPLLVTGAGLAWLIWGDGQRRRGGQSAPFDEGDWDGEVGGRSMSDKAQVGARRAREGAHNLKERASEMGSRIGASIRDGRDRMHDAKESMGEGVDRLRSGWQRTLDEHPLLLGFVGLAAGAAIAAAFPSTRAEDEWLGGASDELKERMGEKGQELAVEARRYAEHAFSGNGRESNGPEPPRAGHEPGRPSEGGNEHSGDRAPDSGARNPGGTFFSNPHSGGSAADGGE